LECQVLHHTQTTTTAFFKEPSKDVWESAVAGDRFQGLVSEIVLLVKSAANPRDGMISEDKNEVFGIVVSCIYGTNFVYMLTLTDLSRYYSHI
jgi:hypothetical protein